jgi:UDP-N-acetylmuramoyl-L-alanyl-D-glutamate--2,6-diaminopimelate ligase
MKLRQLIKNLPYIDVKGSKDIEITGIASHSNRVGPGYLFIAKRGKLFDGNTFIPEALQSGAVAILSDMFDPSIRAATQLIVKDVEEAEGAIAASFWQFPSRELHMVGVTGTSGKTTTTYLMRHLFSHFGMQSGLIGTVSYSIGERESKASHTTPDVITNQKFLREVVRSGVPVCIMEVSSHSLEQGRVAEIDFDTAIFTNLTHEHLDYHKTMDNYAAAKKKLFSSLGKKQNALAIFNAQDPFASMILEGASVRKVGFAIEGVADVVAKDLTMTPELSCFSLEWKGRSTPVRLPLIGRFNVQNALAAAAAFLARGYSLEEVAAGLESVQPPPGRMERIENTLGIAVFVDYAHKEDALRKVLVTIRESAPKELGNNKCCNSDERDCRDVVACDDSIACYGRGARHDRSTITAGSNCSSYCCPVPKRILVVFGCGGDRDREKRPKMARVAEELADIVIVTTDNPRSEQPESIIQEICSGFSLKKHQVIPDRKEAIEKALSLAERGDVVLIAGKGHEKTQIFAREVLDFDDCEVAREFFERL